jgi:hypothetical protein
MGWIVFSIRVRRFVSPLFNRQPAAVHRELAALGRKRVLFRSAGRFLNARS